MRKKWILIGEDDPRDAQLTVLALGRYSTTHEVVVARDGVEILDYLYHRGKYEEHGQGDPAVVLLDIKMPKMDGIEVLRQVKNDERLRTIPIVMMTSSRHEADVMESYRSGANGYIVKPMDFLHYTDALHDFAKFWLLVNESPSPVVVADIPAGAAMSNG
jgi:CheY-like chemotaxis protein